MASGRVPKMMAMVVGTVDVIPLVAGKIQQRFCRGGQMSFILYRLFVLLPIRACLDGDNHPSTMIAGHWQCLKMAGTVRVEALVASSPRQSAAAMTMV